MSLYMNPQIAEALRKATSKSSPVLGELLFGDVFGMDIIADPAIPASAQREVIDDCDPFVDYEGNIDMARANGFTKQESYVPIYQITPPKRSLLDECLQYTPYVAKPPMFFGFGF